MLGAMYEDETTQEDLDLVSSLTSQFNTKLQLTNVTYTIAKVHNQVVGGIMKFIHLNGSNGLPYSVCVYVGF